MIIIKSLIRYKGDLELRWLNGHYDHPRKGRRVIAQFLNHDTGATITVQLPFNMLPFLTLGLVVSQGELQAARRTGRQSHIVLPDLSKSEEIDAVHCSVLSDYNLNGLSGGDQKILRYQTGETTILIPTIELIRFLFLHNRLLAESLLLPSGLMELAVTPLPGVYSDIQIKFTDRVPRKLLTQEFVREFAWLSIDLRGRRAWDSIRRRSGEEHYLTLDPPQLRGCCLEFRGVELNDHWLVLEILSIAGRLLPAETISWAHPLIREKVPKSRENSGGRFPGGQSSENQPRRKREYTLDGTAKSQKNKNQDVVLVGGRRGCFRNSAEVLKVLSPRRNAVASRPFGENPHQNRSVTGHLVNSHLPPIVDRQPASVNDPGWTGGVPPVEFSVLQPAGWDNLGNLSVLNTVLQRIESTHQGLTLTRSLHYLNYGTTFSYCGSRRRAYLLALFTSPKCPPRVLIDVDHTGRNGLAALLLRYDVPSTLADVSRHVEILMEALVNNYGHWDVLIESQLSRFVTIKRLPRLLRMVDRAKDEEYMRRWVKRLNRELHWHQLSLNDAWSID